MIDRLLRQKWSYFLSLPKQRQQQRDSQGLNGYDPITLILTVPSHQQPQQELHRERSAEGDRLVFFLLRLMAALTGWLWVGEGANQWR